MGLAYERRALKFVVSLDCRVTAAVSATDVMAVIEQHLDNVMEHLLSLDAQDPSINLSGDEVEMSVLVEAANPIKAVEKASTLLRTAIHHAEGGTPDWPDAKDQKAWSVWLVNLRSDAVEAPVFA